MTLVALVLCLVALGLIVWTAILTREVHEAIDRANDSLTFWRIERDRARAERERYEQARRQLEAQETMNGLARRGML